MHFQPPPSPQAIGAVKGNATCQHSKIFGDSFLVRTFAGHLKNALIA